jgi:hypothetical protein
MQHRIVAVIKKSLADPWDYTHSLQILRIQESVSPLTRKRVHTIRPEVQRLQDIPPNGYALYRPTVRDKRLQKIAMDFEELDVVEACYMWRLPWSIYYPPLDVRIPVVDSNFPMADDYIYRVRGDTREEYESRAIEAKDIYRNTLGELSGLPYMAYPVSAPLRNFLRQPLEVLRATMPLPPEEPVSAPPALAQKPPAFVAEAMKRDSIQMKKACPISMEVFEDVGAISVTPCFHLFERATLTEWIKKTPLCPVCKAGVELDLCG